MLKRVEIRGYRSLESCALDMGPLRILIGPNAAGKSNVIDALRLLAEAVRSDMETAVSRRGGLDSVAFLGAREKHFSLHIDYLLPDPQAPHSRSDMTYEVVVADNRGRPAVEREALLLKQKRSERGRMKTWFEAHLGRGSALETANGDRTKKGTFDTGDPGVLALKALGFLDAYPRIRAFRTFIESWQFLAVSLDALRAPRRDERAERLEPSAGNLANVLRTMPRGERGHILDNLAAILEQVEDLTTKVDRGQVVLLLKEKLFPDPLEAVALSDGTLRLLAMLTALETMPEHGLLCIEEPEHGLHPLVFGPLLDLIRDRCRPGGTRQVLVTTHAPDLIDAAEPDEVLTVERDDSGATRIEALLRQKLAKWLQDFRLGELWRMRQIGGVSRR